jgi:SNF family Na+-dependent transporter
VPAISSVAFPPFLCVIYVHAHHYYELVKTKCVTFTCESELIIRTRAQVWYEAVTQCFFSLGVVFGMLVNYASFSPLRHNIHR